MHFQSEPSPLADQPRRLHGDQILDPAPAMIVVFTCHRIVAKQEAAPHDAIVDMHESP